MQKCGFDSLSNIYLGKVEGTSRGPYQIMSAGEKAVDKKSSRMM